MLGYLPEPPKGWLGKSENRFWWKCRTLFGLRIGDINSKFKLFRRSILDRMELQSDGEFIHAELLAKANFLGCMMDEIVLTDREPPKPAPDVRKEMWRVFRTHGFDRRRRLRPIPARPRLRSKRLPLDYPELG